MEETKCYCGHTTTCDCGPEQDFKDIELPQQERQETLEEAAERYDSQYINRLRPAFIAGAKWQQERSYSEEEFLEFSEWVSHNDWVYLPSKGYWVNEEQEESEQKFTTKEVFEMFKNK
jgi:hypothetical protein